MRSAEDFRRTVRGARAGRPTLVVHVAAVPRSGVRVGFVVFGLVGVGELVERRTSPAELVRLFEARQLDPARFVTDPEGKTVYDKHTPETFSAVVYDSFRRTRRSVYKRLQGPPIVVVTERAFGFDLRETIINGWSGE